MSEVPDVRPEDALQVAQRALNKVNDLENTLEVWRNALEPSGVVAIDFDRGETDG